MGKITLSSAFYYPPRPKCRACQFFGENPGGPQYHAKCTSSENKIRNRTRKYSHRACKYFQLADWLKNAGVSPQDTQGIKKSCCGMGTYKCQVPMAIKGRRQDIDICIADLVAALNAANITTAASCCGHGHLLGNILLDDGRMITVSKIRRNKNGVVIPLVEKDDK